MLFALPMRNGVAKASVFLAFALIQHDQDTHRVNIRLLLAATVCQDSGLTAGSIFPENPG